jgi:Bacterial membrane protein YfhO
VRRHRAELLAFGLTLFAYVAAWAIGGYAPFGSTPGSLNDESNQYVPIHLLLNGFLHGHGHGDLLFNWHSLFGTSFFPEIATYLGNPFSLAVAVLAPTTLVPTAVLFVAPLTLALAAALMAYYLGLAAPRTPAADRAWWLRALLGSGYGLCSWAVYSSYIPMWMWGLVSFPLLCIAGHWLSAGRGLTAPRWCAATALVALAWGGNFYTGFMATLGAGLVVCASLVAHKVPIRDLWPIGWRAATALGIGIGLTAPFVYPAYRASKGAQPTGNTSFVRATPTQFLAQLFPGTHFGDSIPLLGFGFLGLLLALSFPVNRRVARRTKATWSGLVVLLVFSFQWEPTELLWHGLEQPNGSKYREAFLLSGVLTIVAWQSVSARIGPRTLAMAGTLYAALLGVAVTTPHFPRWSALAAVAGGALAFAAVYLWHLTRDARRGRVLTAFGMTALIGCAAILPIAHLNTLRRDSGWGAPLAVSGPQIAAKTAAVQAVDGWPSYRTDPGPQASVANEPMLVGGEGPAYYSSYMPATSISTLEQLGYGIDFEGRGVSGVDNPVDDAITSIGARVETGAHGAAQTTRIPAPPLVTVHAQPNGPASPATTAGPADSVFAAQERVLGATVYQVPTVQGRTGPISAGTSLDLTATCPSGTVAYWDAPTFGGRISALGSTHTFVWNILSVAEPITGLGTVPASGRITVAVQATARGVIPAQPIGCLDQNALATAVARLTATGGTGIRVGGHDISATLPAGGTGERAGQVAVIATSDEAGWSCATNTGTVAPVGYYGLLAVPLNAATTSVSCTFTPPGLASGTIAGVVCLAVLAAVLAYGAVRRRRTRLPEQ